MRSIPRSATRPRSLASAARRSRVGLLIGLALFSGCTVGPDYVRPSAPESATYREASGWKIAEPADAVPRSAWWEVYRDPQLDALEAQVDVSNQDLRAAEARFRQARALVGSARAAYFPTATLGLAASRTHQSSNLFGNLGGSGGTVSDFSSPLGIAWEPDLWGRIARSVESSEAGAQASAGDLATTRLSLQGELASDYFALRAVDAQRELFEQTLVAYERSLKVTRNRHDAGIASGADVAQAETQLESARAQQVDLGVQRTQLEHAIAVLVGKPPAEVAIPPSPLSATPPAIPVGVPSELLERRPDIAAAERRVAAANAEIGVAEAAYYPTVVLSASGGFESSDFGKWFTWPSRFWSVGPSITETVYDGGLRASQTEAARAAYDETVATYRQSVLGAFQEIEDNLAALRILDEESLVQANAVQAARTSVTLTMDRYEAGTVSYIDVVTTQAAELANERSAVDVFGRRMTASVALIKALGGGFEAGDLPSAAALAEATP